MALNGVSIDVLFPSQRAQQMTHRPSGTALNIMPCWRVSTAKAVTACVASRFCHSLIKSWCGLRVVQMLLGHSDLSTTQIYSMSLPSVCDNFINSITRGRDSEKNRKIYEERFYVIYLVGRFSGFVQADDAAIQQTLAKMASKAAIFSPRP